MRTTWQQYKTQGKQSYQSGNYDEALSNYLKALDLEYTPTLPPQSEHEIILSNIIACRLQIGGPDMARLAIEEAKQCIAMNRRWAKAHIRLASAYIALGGHSNDACNALQTALNLDPGNVTARRMLVSELRRERVGATTNNNSSTTDYNSTNININTASSYSVNGVHPSAPPVSDQGDFHTWNRNDNNNDNNIDTSLDESFTLQQRLFNYVSKIKDWYNEEISEETRTIIKLLVFITVLYVAFGGRFGLDSIFASKNLRNDSNNGNNNYNSDYNNMVYNRDDGVYNQYRRQHASSSSSSRTTQRQQREESRIYDYNQPYPRSSSSNYGYDNSRGGYYSHYNNHHYHRNSNRYFSSIDGSFVSMIFIVIMLFILKQLGIISPDLLRQIMLMMGGVGRFAFRRRGMFGRGGGGFQYGGYYPGGGGMMGRRRWR